MGLNSRQGGGGDLPSLDLAFALDRSFTTDPADAGKALITSRRGPTAKFSRGSGATQVNAAGLIEWAPENLILRSEEFDHSGWVKLRTSVDDNATTDPAGTQNADKLIEDSSTGSHMTYRLAVLNSLVPHTFSVYAKADGRNFMYLQCGDGFPVNCHAYFDLSTGTTGTVGANATANIEPAGNGWYRCSVTATPSSLTTNGFYIQPTAVNGSTSYAGDGVSGIYLWGAQVERASTARTYYPTTTAAFYGPRFDHDPVTGVCKGLLIEEPRTNLAFPSDMSSPWSVSRVTATPATDSPLGTYQILTVVDTTGAARLTRTVVVSSSQPYTISVFAKAGTISSFSFRAITDASSSVVFNLLNGTTSGSSQPGWSGQAQITPYPNGWYRCSMTYTPTALSQNYCVDLVYTELGQTINFTGFQLEAGAFPLSYIPTTSGTAARSADVGSIIGDDFSSFYNQSEGTILARADKTMSSNATGSYLSFFAGATEVGPLITRTSSQLLARIRNSAGSDIANADFTETPNGLKSVAAAWKANSITSDRAVVTNGVLVTLTNLQAVDAASNQSSLNIGSRATGVSIFNGHIARIQYFRKRLSNAKLQTITAP